MLLEKIKLSGFKSFVNPLTLSINGKLTALEDVVTKTDKKTRLRFKATFDRINTDLQAKISQNVQFLFISQHKVTMEIAQQLIGVAMREAGFSKMVTVNIENSAHLAEG